jgi:membrane protein implicated in regulation of membrane protease activity
MRLQTVALLKPLPAADLARGQVGTVVEELDAGTVLVEFSDDDGRAYAVEPFLRTELLVLHYEREPAE